MFEDERRSFLNDRVTVIVGDITRERVCAVVNAGNATLLGGGGVDGAIHRAGGPRILQQCQKIRRTRYPQGLPTGEAVLTTGGNLPARFVIHTVGPVYNSHQGREAGLLASCYHHSMWLAVENDLTSVAFPSISTGAYGYPRDEAAVVASAAIKNFLASESGAKIEEVRLVFFSASDAQVFLRHQQFD